MFKRRYESLGLSESASIILREVVYNNESGGWCSKSEETLNNMKLILNKFNLSCTQDSNGNSVWGLK